MLLLEVDDIVWEEFVEDALAHSVVVGLAGWHGLLGRVATCDSLARDGEGTLPRLSLASAIARFVLDSLG